MNTTIEISDSLFQRIQKHAVAFVDKTPADVIERWANIVEAKDGASTGPAFSLVSPSPSPSGNGLRKFEPSAPPDLLFTRANGTFGGVSFRKWNDLVKIAHIKAFESVGSFDALRRITGAQIAPGHKTDAGYHHVGAKDFSIQYVDANHAWRHAYSLARYLKIPIHINLEWRDTKRAKLRGERGTLSWLPS